MLPGIDVPFGSGCRDLRVDWRNVNDWRSIIIRLPFSWKLKLQLVCCSYIGWFLYPFLVIANSCGYQITWSRIRIWSYNHNSQLHTHILYIHTHIHTPWCFPWTVSHTKPLWRGHDLGTDTSGCVFGRSGGVGLGLWIRSSALWNGPTWGTKNPWDAVHFSEVDWFCLHQALALAQS